MVKFAEKIITETNSVTAKPPRRKKPEYSGSRWAGLILLIITFIVSLFFYARAGLGDFLSALFSPAKYTIQK